MRACPAHSKEAVRGKPGRRRGEEGPPHGRLEPESSGLRLLPSSAPGTKKRPRIPPAGLGPAPAQHSTAGPRTYRAGGESGESGGPGSSCAPEPPGPVRHLRRAGRGRAGPRRWAGGGAAEPLRRSGGGKRPRALGSGPRAGDSTQRPRAVAAPGAALAPPRPRARPAPASRRAPHWAKGRGAEGAALARRGRSAPVPVPLLTRRRHGEAAAAHQPPEELLRWRFRGRLPGVRGAPAGHHQGEVTRGARG